MELAIAVALCFGSGFLLVSLGWPPASESQGPPPQRRRNLRLYEFEFMLLRVSLSLGFGVGIFAIVFFLTRVFGVRNLIVVDLLVFLGLLAGMLLARRFGVGRTQMRIKIEDDDAEPAWFGRILIAASALAVGVAAYAAIAHSRAYPHGAGWDAFAIWNLRARFLFLGGGHWRDGFTPLLPWSHPDYPLLLPASIAHFWTYSKVDDPRVPAVLGLVFTFATAGVLFAALSILRGRIHAMLGAIALLTTPAFIEQGTWQYADVPLSFFFLSTIALICLSEADSPAPSPLRGVLFLAGIAAGLAAWTKNEGVLFLCTMILARQVMFIRQFRKHPQGRIPFVQHSAWLLLGCAPLILLLIYFKHRVAPPGDLFSGASAVVRRLVEPGRYWVVLRWVGKGLLRFGNWLVIPGTLLLASFFFFVRREDRDPNPGPRGAAWAVALTFAGYFVIYVITPYDIYWHLRFSLGRLFLQLWPSTIFLAFALGQLGFGPGVPSAEADSA